jgi:hypothetical protein
MEFLDAFYCTWDQGLDLVNNVILWQIVSLNTKVEAQFSIFQGGQLVSSCVPQSSVSNLAKKFA